MLAYSPVTVIAEKFDAMIDLAQINSRMKDFYDVYRLLATERYQEATLGEAIGQTLRWRQTVLTAHHPLFSAGFATYPQRTRQWLAFLKKTGMAESPSFVEVMQLITEKLRPVYQILVEQTDAKGGG
ncbi:nucleotidyl transferase AbiEii/AbiGii toxin family protein [Fibrella forsythiae]|uniref:nucleotidyl transferase AbiEii/AbiGii toxin family protein n=1 Tax=Fibrella forsythiae TaxID=2817061 RepID=UPI00286DB103|nr:nucleotidyl transferase AbiEii/AbiGii toxin family protein [Fibrella forsythiae]